jgi:hypothetical protein
MLSFSLVELGRVGARKSLARPHPGHSRTTYEMAFAPLIRAPRRGRIAGPAACDVGVGR